jgi:two-component system sensor histidine kinase KdpD
LTPYGTSLVLVLFVTLVVALVRTVSGASNASIIYLLAVLAAAVLFGSRPAIVAAIASFFAYNFFFIEPLYRFTVSDEEEWLSLGLLLVTGIVTGQLAANLGDRAREAERREREAVILYDVVRLMAEPELQRALTSVAERLRIELELSVVTIAFGGDGAIRAQADAGEPESLALARDALARTDRLLVKGAVPTGATRGQTGRWIKVMPPTRRSVFDSERTRRIPIVLQGQETGALILVARSGAPPFNREEDRILSVVASQLGLTFERLRLQRDANEAEVLRRTDELRTALVNAVSHDLRTPLASIIASAGSLSQDDITWTEEERREFIAAIEQEALRLNRLVANLLDLSRIESGSLKPEKGWYDLGSLVEEALGRLGDLAQHHTVTALIPKDLPPLEFDYVEIDQALSNIVENALRHTPDGTTVSVAIIEEDGQVRVEVADTGPGISPDALPRLFDPFFRVPAGAFRHSGSGLGLSVAKGFVEAHGGQIWAENLPAGGAKFTFTLPVTLGASVAPANASTS